jgi:hypothetical protein
MFKGRDDLSQVHISNDLNAPGPKTKGGSVFYNLIENFSFFCLLVDRHCNFSVHIGFTFYVLLKFSTNFLKRLGGTTTPPQDYYPSPPLTSNK